MYSRFFGKGMKMSTVPQRNQEKCLECLSDKPAIGEVWVALPVSVLAAAPERRAVLAVGTGLKGRAEFHFSFAAGPNNTGTRSADLFDELRRNAFLRPVPVVGPAGIAHAHFRAGVPERRQLRRQQIKFEHQSNFGSWVCPCSKRGML